LGYHFARLVEEVPYPEADILFIERDIYEHLLPLEYALCCQGTGRVGEARKVYERLLQRTDLPPVTRALAEGNLAVLPGDGSL
jgi:hypothetical protein